jgi:hypothetical protein
VIGKVTWGNPDVGYTRTAVLRDGMRWEVPEEPAMADRLAEYYAMWPSGPSAGEPGHAELNDLARRMGGSVWFEPRTPDPPGTIY